MDRKPNIIDALRALLPTKWCWSFPNNLEYEEMVWHDESVPIPTKQEVENKLNDMIANKPYDILRIERNKRLTRCDWVATKAFTTDTPIPDEWKVYMQALRDLPANTADPENPVWPEAPE